MGNTNNGSKKKKKNVKIVSFVICPLSPFLFVLVMEALGRMLDKAIHEVFMWVVYKVDLWWCLISSSLMTRFL